MISGVGVCGGEYRESMLALYEKLDQAKRLLQQQIEVTDSEIDRLVYKLYALTSVSRRWGKTVINRLRTLGV